MTERAKKLLLLYYEQSRKIRRVSGLPPLTFKDNGKDLKNYRIYGQSSRNLFDGNFMHKHVSGEFVVDDNNYGRSIVIDISSFNNGDKITFSRKNIAGSRLSLYQISSLETGGRMYTNSMVSPAVDSLSVTFTIANGSNYPYLMIYLNDNNTAITDEELLSSNIMLNSGSTALPYETYGESVGDRTANLFDENQQMTTGIINSDGTINNSITYAEYTDYIPINTETAYTFCVVYNSSPKNIRIAFYNSSKQFINRATSGGINATISFNKESHSDASFIRACLDKEWISCMLNTGSTALPYEPYGFRVPVTVEGKNLLQASDFEGGAIFTGTRYINLDYSNSKTPRNSYLDYDSTRKRSTKLISIVGTYTISIADGWEFGIVMFPNNINSGEEFIYHTAPVTISDCTFAIQIRKTDVSVISSADISDYQIMLNSGSIATPYEPYHAPVTTNLYLPEQIKMVGDEAEYIDYDKQKMVKKSKTITFTNSNGWKLEGSNNFYANIPLDGALSPSYVIENSMNIPSVYLVLSSVLAAGVDSNIWISTTGRLNVYLTTIDHTLEALGQLFENTPLIVTYELVNMNELDVTLPALPTLSGTNTLSVGTEVQPSEVYVEGKIRFIHEGSSENEGE